jgi:hypothetical protein
MLPIAAIFTAAIRLLACVQASAVGFLMLPSSAIYSVIHQPVVESKPAKSNEKQQLRQYEQLHTLLPKRMCSQAHMSCLERERDAAHQLTPCMATGWPSATVTN